MSQDAKNPDAKNQGSAEPTEEELAAVGPAPQRPRKRRFQGTAQQISGSLTFYKVFAFITGIMLLLLVAKMIMDYGFGQEIYIGGTTASGAENTFGVHPDGAVTGGQAVSFWVAVVHGWIYVIYVIAGFRLWYLMNWRFSRLVMIVLGGVVPFLSFIVERKIASEVHGEMQANPEAVRRY